eukprot:EG_transcript_69
MASPIPPAMAELLLSVARDPSDRDDAVARLFAALAADAALPRTLAGPLFQWPPLYRPADGTNAFFVALFHHSAAQTLPGKLKVADLVLQVLKSHPEPEAAMQILLHCGILPATVDMLQAAVSTATEHQGSVGKPEPLFESLMLLLNALSYLPPFATGFLGHAQLLNDLCAAWPGCMSYEAAREGLFVLSNLCRSYEVPLEARPGNVPLLFQVLADPRTPDAPTVARILYQYVLHSDPAVQSQNIETLLAAGLLDHIVAHVRGVRLLPPEERVALGQQNIMDPHHVTGYLLYILATCLSDQEVALRFPEHGIAPVVAVLLQSRPVAPLLALPNGPQLAHMDDSIKMSACQALECLSRHVQFHSALLGTDGISAILATLSTLPLPPNAADAHTLVAGLRAIRHLVEQFPERKKALVQEQFFPQLLTKLRPGMADTLLHEFCLLMEVITTGHMENDEASWFYDAVSHSFVAPLCHNLRHILYSDGALAAAVPLATAATILVVLARLALRQPDNREEIREYLTPPDFHQLRLVPPLKPPTEELLDILSLLDSKADVAPDTSISASLRKAAAEQAGVEELQVAREDQGAPHRPAEEEQAAQEEPTVQEEQGAKEEAQHWPAEEEAAKEEPAVQEEQGSKEEAQHWLAEEEQAAGVLTEPEGRPPAVEVEEDPEDPPAMVMSSGETTPGSAAPQFALVDYDPTPAAEVRENECPLPSDLDQADEGSTAVPAVGSGEERREAALPETPEAERWALEEEAMQGRRQLEAQYQQRVDLLARALQLRQAAAAVFRPRNAAVCIQRVARGWRCRRTGLLRQYKELQAMQAVAYGELQTLETSAWDGLVAEAEAIQTAAQREEEDRLAVRLAEVAVRVQQALERQEVYAPQLAPVFLTTEAAARAAPEQGLQTQWWLREQHGQQQEEKRMRVLLEEAEEDARQMASKLWREKAALLSQLHEKPTLDEVSSRLLPVNAPNAQEANVGEATTASVGAFNGEGAQRAAVEEPTVAAAKEGAAPAVSAEESKGPPPTSPPSPAASLGQTPGADEPTDAPPPVDVLVEATPSEPEDRDRDASPTAELEEPPDNAADATAEADGDEAAPPGEVEDGPPEVEVPGAVDEPESPTEVPVVDGADMVDTEALARVAAAEAAERSAADRLAAVLLLQAVGRAALCAAAAQAMGHLRGLTTVEERQRREIETTEASEGEALVDDVTCTLGQLRATVAAEREASALSIQRFCRGHQSRMLAHRLSQQQSPKLAAFRDLEAEEEARRWTLEDDEMDLRNELLKAEIEGFGVATHLAEIRRVREQTALLRQQKLLVYQKMVANLLGTEQRDRTRLEEEEEEVFQSILDLADMEEKRLFLQLERFTPELQSALHWDEDLLAEDPRRRSTRMSFWNRRRQTSMSVMGFDFGPERPSSAKLGTFLSADLACLFEEEYLRRLELVEWEAENWHYLQEARSRHLAGVRQFQELRLRLGHAEARQRVAILDEEAAAAKGIVAELRGSATHSKGMEGVREVEVADRCDIASDEILALERLMEPIEIMGDQNGLGCAARFTHLPYGLRRLAIRLIRRALRRHLARLRSQKYSFDWEERWIHNFQTQVPVQQHLAEVRQRLARRDAEAAARRVAAHRHGAVVTVQRWWRGRLVRLWLLNRSWAVVDIQRIVRGLLGRRKAAKQKKLVEARRLKEAAAQQALQEQRDQKRRQREAEAEALVKHTEAVAKAEAKRAAARTRREAEEAERRRMEAEQRASRIAARKEAGGPADGAAAAKAAAKPAATAAPPTAAPSKPSPPRRALSPKPAPSPQRAAPPPALRSASPKPPPARGATAADEEVALAALEEQAATADAEGQQKRAYDLYTDLLRRQRVAGLGQVALDALVVKLAELGNAVAHALIQLAQWGSVGRYLQQVSTLTQAPLPSRHPDLDRRRMIARAHMHHNYTCLHKRNGDIQAALRSTEKALGILHRFHLLDQLPTCYLNVCALYSSLGLHDEALQQALRSIEVAKALLAMAQRYDAAQRKLEVQIRHTSCLGEFTLPDDIHRMVQDGRLRDMFAGDTWQATGPERLELFGTQYAIAHYDMAVEQEFLGRTAACLETYGAAGRMAEELLGPQHPLAVKFRRAHAKARLAAEHREVGEDAAPAASATRSFVRPKKTHSLPDAAATMPALPTSHPPRTMPMAATLGAGATGPPRSSSLGQPEAPFQAWGTGPRPTHRLPPLPATPGSASTLHRDSMDATDSPVRYGLLESLGSATPLP